MQQSITWIQAGFFRRGFSMIIDCLLISLVVFPLGILLYEPTSGSVRAETTLLDSARCEDATIDPADLQLPNDFNITNARICTVYFLGHQHDRVLRIVETKRTVSSRGTATSIQTAVYPIDQQGYITSPLYLDYLILPLFAVYSVVFGSMFGWTPGQRILGLRFRSSDGRPMTFRQAAIRTTALLVPAMPHIGFLVTLMTLGPIPVNALMTGHSIIVTLSIMMFMVLFPNFFFLHAYIVIRRGDLPWHDRLARTEVVRRSRWFFEPLPKVTPLSAEAPRP